MSIKPNDIPPDLPHLFTDMTIFQFREVKWETANGRILPLREVEDTHLANIIWFCLLRPTTYGEDFIAMLKSEAASRNLTEDFLSRSPFPYRARRGHWVVPTED